MSKLKQAILFDSGVLVDVARLPNWRLAVTAVTLVRQLMERRWEVILISSQSDRASLREAFASAGFDAECHHFLHWADVAEGAWWATFAFIQTGMSDEVDQKKPVVFVSSSRLAIWSARTLLSPGWRDSGGRGGLSRVVTVGFAQNESDQFFFGGLGCQFVTSHADLSELLIRPEMSAKGGEESGQTPTS